jgi:DNA-binding transcriptional ArsR family regulator
MLDLLRQRPRTVAELAEPFHLTLGTITEHVRALRVAGVVTYRSRGPKHEYTLVRDRLRPIEQWIIAFTKQAPSPARGE